MGQVEAAEGMANHASDLAIAPADPGKGASYAIGAEEGYRYRPWRRSRSVG